MTFSKRPTHIINAWLEEHDFTRCFWTRRAEEIAGELPPEDARQQLAEELQRCLRMAQPEDSLHGVWGSLTSWAMAQIDWDELAAHWLADTRQAAIWSRLGPAMAPQPD